MLTSLIVLLVTASSPAATLTFTAPAGWTSKPSTSTMRVAEFVLPKVAGDAEDASLVVYFFGGQGGSAQANIDRWISQMEQPSGKPSKDVAVASSMTVNGLKISLVDVSGTYTAEMSPGSADHVNKTGFRLKAAMIETPGGPYYIKLTGPAKTVAKWDASLTAFLKTLQYKP
jgi:hypothetical protein